MDTVSVWQAIYCGTSTILQTTFPHPKSSQAYRFRKLDEFVYMSNIDQACAISNIKHRDLCKQCCMELGTNSILFCVFFEHCSHNRTVFINLLTLSTVD